jgi:cell division control protein 6
MSSYASIKNLGRSSIFEDEGKLDVSYVPPMLPHRESQYGSLLQTFRGIIDNPGKVGPKAIIVGRIGTGKTALSQRFGLDLEAMAKERGSLRLQYVHVNCHLLRGSLALILTEVISRFFPNFPRRGLSSEELLQTLMKVLDEEDAYLLLALDDAEVLIQREGPASLYDLTRIHEGRLNKPLRLGLILILREAWVLSTLDQATLSTLQRNIIRLPAYERNELFDILRYRASLALKKNAISEESLGLIADLCASEGDARFAIEILLRAGKGAERYGNQRVLPEHVREAYGSLGYPPSLLDYLRSIGLHEKLLLLAVVKELQASPEKAYVTMGSVERSYNMVCEERGEQPRSHTQLWKYMATLSAIGLVSTKISGEGQRGKTTLIGMHYPASSMEKAVLENL